MNNKKSLNDTLKELYKTDRKKYSVYVSCIVIAIFAFAILWGVMLYAIANTSSCEHEYKITEEIAPTYTEKGKVVKECSLCGDEQIDILPQLPAPTYIEGVDYEEIYKAYKANALRAEDTYKNNRYRITAEINGMSTGGLLNLTGGATLTMLIKIDNTYVYFLAEFEKDQVEALKSVNVGDTITFEGECASDGLWTECELVTE